MRCFFFLFERLKVNDLYDEKGVCCVCAGALGLASLFAAVFERPTLRGCQRWATLCRVKAHRALTLPCQKTNPDGVILGGKRVGMVVCGNRLSLMGLFEARMNGEWVPEDQWIIFNGLLLVASIEEWRWKHGETGFRRPMDNLQWAFVGGKYRRMAMEAWRNGLQKIKWIIFNGHLEGARIEERR